MGLGEIRLGEMGQKLEPPVDIVHSLLTARAERKPRRYDNV